MNELQRQIGRKIKDQAGGSPFQKQFNKVASPDRRKKEEQKSEEEMLALKAMIG